MEGSVLVSNSYYNNNNENQNEPTDTDFTFSQLNTPTSPSSPSKAFTKVYHSSDNANNALLQFIDRAKTNIDCCVGITAPSVFIEIDAIREKRMSSFRERGVKFRYVTEITKDNIGYVKQMLSFSEIKHLDGMRGNFEVADQREYVAVAKLQEAKSLPQLIFSNVPEIVEQQQFVFDSFWKMATPARQRIMEIERGIIPAETIVYSDYHDAVKKEYEMIRKAKKEIQIMYSTVNAFHLQEKDGYHAAFEGDGRAKRKPTDKPPLPHRCVNQGQYVSKAFKKLRQKHQHPGHCAKHQHQDKVTGG